MMDSRTFFEKAVEAAKKSPEAFAAEFKHPDANANAFFYVLSSISFHEENLINALISQIPDENLPAILTTLVDHQVDLSDGRYFITPLSKAAYYGKKRAVDFLLEKKVNINAPTSPAIIAAIKSDSANKIEIVKVLVEKGANLNIRSSYGYSPLMEAIELADPKLVELLLSENADLFLKGFLTFDGLHQTALSLAYKKYFQKKEEFGDDYSHTIQSENCFEILVRYAAIKCLELNPLSANDISILREYIKDLTGGPGFHSNFPLQSSMSLKKELEKVIPPLMKKIKNEQRHAFLMGSCLTKKQEEKKENLPIFRFFKQDGEPDLCRLIFSFVYSEKEQEAKASEGNATRKRKR